MERKKYELETEKQEEIHKIEDWRHTQAIVANRIKKKRAP